MEVSVSPRATTWALPLVTAGCAVSLATVAAAGTGAGVASPITVPGRETCCSSFKICWESVSILALISSIFFSSALVSPGDGESCGGSANPPATGSRKTVQRARNFIQEILTPQGRTGKRAWMGFVRRYRLENWRKGCDSHDFPYLFVDARAHSKTG